MAIKVTAKKPAVRKATIAQALPLLTLWSDANFSGGRLRFRGNLGVRSLSVFNFNDVLSSFEFTGRSFSTLVLFADDNYQGDRRVYRGSINVAALPTSFNDKASSFVMSSRRLSDLQIDNIQLRGVAPTNFAEVLPGGTVTMNGKRLKRK